MDGGGRVVTMAQNGKENGRTVRVVVTGMGAMTPLGESPDEFWRNLADGKSGVGPMTLCDPRDTRAAYRGK